MKASFTKTIFTLLFASVSVALPISNVLAADAGATVSVIPGHVAVTVTAAPDSKVSVSSDAKDEDSKDEDSKDEDSKDEDKDNGHDTSDSHSFKYDHHWNSSHHGNDSVGVGHDVSLAAGEQTHDLVAVFGSAISDGEVAHDVVSVFGSTQANGTVGHDAVAVFGNTYVNNKVGHDVVAVFGSVELGPQAEVSGQIVAVGSSVKRDPAAIVHGSTQHIGVDLSLGSFEWLHPWINNCLLLGRPLAFVAGLTWAWTLALVSLFFYVFTALLFRRGVERCVQVLDAHPGHSLLAALLTVIATPVLIFLLVITIIGIIAIPFVGLGLLAVSSFGKLVMLAWLGRRLVKPNASSSFIAHPAFAVLLGGIIATMLYVVPFVGFIVYKLLGFVGMGVVMYTLLLALQSRRFNNQSGSIGSGPSAHHETAAAAADLANAQGNFGTSESVRAPPDAQSTGNTPEPTAPESKTQQGQSAYTARSVAVSDLPRAGFWLRMLALLLDAILINAVISFTFKPERLGFDSDHLFLVVLAVYGAVMWKLKGATIGDIICKIQVVRVDAREFDWATAVVRSLSCFLSLVVIGLGFIWIAFDEHKQAWHDKIAGTVVVRVPHSMSLI